MPELLRTILAFGLVLGVLVFIHELGHYLAARWMRVHVEVFSIGFGKVLLRWHDRVGTEWRLCALPFGGYVKPHGIEGPGEATPEMQAGWQPGRTFHDKPVGARALVILAGPVFNFLLAILLFAGLFALVGKPSAAPVVGQVIAGSAAEKAGLKQGDVIERIGTSAIHSFDDVERFVMARPGAAVSLRIGRAGRDIDVPVTLGRTAANGEEIGQLGIMSTQLSSQRLDPLRAVVAAAQETWNVTVQVAQGLWQLATGQRGTSGLKGPLGIAQLSGQVAQLGIANLVSFMALLSINLGLFNLLPIPVFDGGRLVFYAFEAVLGRPLPARVQEYGARLGLAVIAFLFVFSTLNDLSHFGLFQWLRSGVARLIG